MSIFSVMGVANRGLSASQMGLSVTSQNIANADTEGYSRKRLTLAADYRYDGALGQIGMGVSIVNIARVRDASIDAQIQRQSHQLGYFKEMDTSLETIENIFNEPSNTGIISYMDKFFDSWNNLVNNPADISARTTVSTAAKTLTDVFKNTALELDKLQESRNTNVAGTVDKINKIGREVFNLNKEIASVEIGGQNANDSRDRRDMLMKDLAGLVDYDSVEGENGQISVSVGGNIFISGVSFNGLEVYSGKEIQTSTTYLQYGVKMQGVNHPLQINGGELKAMMDARDLTVPAYKKTLDDLALALTSSVNAQHREGYNLTGFSGFDFFDPSATGASTIGLSASISTNLANIAAARGGTQATGTTVAVPGGTMNFGNAPTQLAKTLGRPWVVGDASTESVSNVVSGSVTVKIATSGALLTEGTDFNVNYIDGTVQMLHPGYDGLALNVDYSYTTGNFPGPGNNENAIKLAALRDKLSMSPDRLGNNTSSFSDFYSGMIGDVGLERTEAKSNLETREYLVLQYENSQESIAGVSLDEEMSNLIKYQHTYQAAAKIISTAQQMLDVLMNI